MHSCLGYRTAADGLVSSCSWLKASVDKLRRGGIAGGGAGGLGRWWGWVLRRWRRCCGRDGGARAGVVRDDVVSCCNFDAVAAWEWSLSSCSAYCQRFGPSNGTDADAFSLFS